MVNSNKNADIKLDEKYNKEIDPIDSKIPKNNAWFELILPEGIGLFKVLFIFLSKFDSK